MKKSPRRKLRLKRNSLSKNMSDYYNNMVSIYSSDKKLLKGISPHEFQVAYTKRNLEASIHAEQMIRSLESEIRGK